MISHGILEGMGLNKQQMQWITGSGLDNNVANISSSDRSISIDFISESLNSQTRVPKMKDLLKKNYNSFITLGIKSEEWLDELIKLNVPTVIVDNLNDKYNYLADQVFIDPHPAFNQLIEYFLNNKINVIHFILGYTSIPAPDNKMNFKEVAKFRNRMMMVDPDSQYRFNIFKRLAEDKGIIIKSEWVHSYQPMDYSMDDIAKIIYEMPGADHPQAVICPGIGNAETIMKYFYQRNEKIFCAGLTNDKYNGPAIPIRVYCENLGLVRIELLLSKMQRPKRGAIRAGVPMELLLNESFIKR
jgi:DNA-binding LacI/PurR family transcriptional regulator